MFDAVYSVAASISVAQAPVERREGEARLGTKGLYAQQGALRIDVGRTLWDNPTMNTARVDSKKRIVLPNGRPGEVFEIQQQDEDHVLLVRLQRPEAPQGVSRQACVRAMESAPLTPTLSWEALRQLTREP